MQIYFRININYKSTPEDCYRDCVNVLWSIFLAGDVQGSCYIKKKTTHKVELAETFCCEPCTAGFNVAKQKKSSKTETSTALLAEEDPFYFLDNMIDYYIR
jgi:hypothetical protein